MVQKMKSTKQNPLQKALQKAVTPVKEIDISHKVTLKYDLADALDTLTTLERELQNDVAPDYGFRGHLRDQLKKMVAAGLPKGLSFTQDMRLRALANNLTLDKSTATALLLAPGQWKMVGGVRIENTTGRMLRVFVQPETMDTKAPAPKSALSDKPCRYPKCKDEKGICNTGDCPISKAPHPSAELKRLREISK